jgi:hypothetical protein
MNQIYSYQQAGADNASFLCGAPIELPEPALLPLPVTPVEKLAAPRSAKRAYSQEELATTAVMLKKLHRREDLTSLIRHELPVEYDKGRAIDTVVDRLLRTI